MTFQKLHHNSYVSDSDVLLGLDEETEDRLKGTRLWTVVALCALSSVALGKMEALHGAAMEEDRLAKRLQAVADYVDDLTVLLSSHTKFGCLLLTNMPDLQVCSSCQAPCCRTPAVHDTGACWLCPSALVPVGGAVPVRAGLVCSP